VIVGTPRDFYEADALRYKARRAGFYIDGGYSAIVLRALPATVKRFKLCKDADLCHVTSVEAASAWLSGWMDREVYDAEAREKRAKRAKSSKGARRV
jgi:ribosome modulation factor